MITYSMLIQWVSEHGRLGKIRFNAHGDGQGNIAMRQAHIEDLDGTITKGTKETCTGTNIANWLCNNGYFNEFNLGVLSGVNKTRSTSRAQNVVDQTTYSGTMLIAACMAAKGVAAHDMNPSALENKGKGYDKAHEQSVISGLAKAIETKKLPSIRITGAHEVVAFNNQLGLVRKFKLFIHVDPSLNHTVYNNGKEWFMTTKIPSAVFKTSITQESYLAFTDDEWNNYSDPDRSSFININDPSIRCIFDNSTYVIHSLSGVGPIYVCPPHGTRFDLMNNIVTIVTSFKIDLNSNISLDQYAVGERLAKSNAKVSIITSDNSRVI